MAQCYATTSSITGSTSAQTLMSIENPAASTISVLLQLVQVSGIVNATTTSVFFYHMGRTTGLPTGGTQLTSQHQTSTDPAIQAIVRQAPTATLATGSIWMGSPGIIAGSLLGGVAQISQYNGLALNDWGSEANGLVLLPGEGLLVTADANLTSWIHSVNVIWIEF